MWAVTHYVVKIHVQKLAAVMYFYVAKLVKTALPY